MVGQHGKVNGWHKRTENEDKNTDFVVIRLNYHSIYETGDTMTRLFLDSLLPVRVVEVNLIQAFVFWGSWNKSEAIWLYKGTNLRGSNRGVLKTRFSLVVFLLTFNPLAGMRVCFQRELQRVIALTQAISANGAATDILGIE